MPRIIEGPKALKDVSESTDYLAREGSVEIAERFLDALEVAYAELASMPFLGRKVGFRIKRAASIHSWHVGAEFQSWRIFYRPRRDGVVILRVLHGARDIPPRFRSYE